MAELSAVNFEYLQRVELHPQALPAGAARAVVPHELRRLSRVEGVIRAAKASIADPAQPLRLVSEDLLAGLAGHGIPLVFKVTGDSTGVDVAIGTWVRHTSSQRAEVLERQHEILHSLLRGLYPAVNLAAVDAHTGEQRWSRAGLLRGIPAATPPAPPELWLPLDRLLNALQGLSWRMLVLAEPVADVKAKQLRRTVIAESRQVAEVAARAQHVGHPLAAHYQELLQLLLTRLTHGGAVGLWRTGVYLLGDESSYHRLVGSCRGLLAGEASLLEPLRSWDYPQAIELAAAWELPDVPEEPGPGAYHHPFRYQTLLSSSELASYVHFPEHEAPGFAVAAIPHFDTVSPRGLDDSAIGLGSIVHRTQPTPAMYRLSTDWLSRHAFVAGITGSGKTNTVFHLLQQAAAAGLPFLVVEPAKREYRTLMHDAQIGGGIRVFTLGEERVSPFRLNPFEVPAGIPVAQHLDLLRSAFAASFGMWTPLPQVLERCLHEIYVDRGWNLTRNSNRRLAEGGDPAPAFPTLADLVAKVAEVVPQLGYDQRIAADIQAALTTRLEALRTGAKGTMLDVSRSIPMALLLDHPTILELEPLGDDDDKAFLMALLLIRLVEHRRVQGESSDPRHLFVIEEAHRLLSAAPRRTGEEQADPRGKAVESFAQLLSEIRAYGQGVVIADQVPTRLAPDVIKNTALKIAHRTVAADDREMLAGAMAMDEHHATYLTVLPIGQAAVFGQGDDMPMLVQTPLVKGGSRPDDAEVAERMAGWRAEHRLGAVFEPAPYCEETCAESPEACEASRLLAANEPVQKAFARMVLSTVEEPGALDRLWPDYVATIRAHRPVEVDEQPLLRSLAGHLAEWLASRRGREARWSYAMTDAFSTALRAMLIEKQAAAGRSTRPNLPTGAREAFQTVARAAHERTFAPYPACDSVCDQASPPLCIYRHWLADVVTSQRHGARWRQAEQQDLQRPDLRAISAWDVSQDAGYEVIEFPENDLPDDLRQEVGDAARRACLCFAQQMLAGDATKVSRTAQKILTRILDEAGMSDNPAVGGEPGVSTLLKDRGITGDEEVPT